MRIAITSDTHFGDPMCTLVDHESMKPGSRYDRFLEAAGTDNDYLVLAGDILDFSITDYQTAHTAAAVFFRKIKEDGIAHSIIYVPGNHDYDLWHTVEYQINVIHQISKGKPARQFKWSVPGVIDQRSSAGVGGLKLPGTLDEFIDPRTEAEMPLYLNNITNGADGSGESTNFYFVYPNLYVVDDSGAVLITHGHYLESYWSLPSEWILKIVEEDLKLGDAYDLWELVALNLPLCQLACSGIGQAGPLTKLVQTIQREVKDREFERVDKYIDRLDKIIDRMLAYSDLSYKEWITDAIMNSMKDKLKDEIKKRKTTRFREEFIYNPEVLERFRTYYSASCVELAMLNQNFNIKIPNPAKIIFGHTHRPIKWQSPEAPKAMNSAGAPVWMYNTGGWLWRKDKHGGKEFCGAEVFIYENNKFSSVAID